MTALCNFCSIYLKDCQFFCAFVTLRYIQHSPTDPIVLFDVFKAMIVPNAQHFEVGDTLKAELFLTTSTSALKYKVKVSGREVWANKHGKAHYTAVTTQAGNFELDVVMVPQSAGNETIIYPAKLYYEVKEPCKE